MRIVVTGREGQVARSLIERGAERDGVEIVTVARPELDLGRLGTVMPSLAAARPDIVVSAAAYTAVDQAESEPELAHAINAVGAGAVADAAARLGVPIIHLSTDYVFDGTSERPYTEDNRPAPQSVYGASKLAGEQNVAKANPHHLILRTAWVFSPFGSNFVKTMLRLAADRDRIAVVADQWGNPTSALDIAEAILHIAASLGSMSQDAWGVYHLAGTGTTSWATFARYVLDTSQMQGGPHADVLEITTSQFPTKARRPISSRLATDKLTGRFGWTAPEWQDSARDTVHRLIFGHSETLG